VPGYKLEDAYETSWDIFHAQFGREGGKHIIAGEGGIKRMPHPPLYNIYILC
jgi:hypothetical protein